MGIVALQGQKEIVWTYLSTNRIMWKKHHETYLHTEKARAQARESEELERLSDEILKYMQMGKPKNYLVAVSFYHLTMMKYKCFRPTRIVSFKNTT